MQPFRFCNLPVELQQHILGLYYGNTATVIALYEPRVSYDKSTDSYGQSSSSSFYGTTIRISPFLVSRRFNNEALYALERARNDVLWSIYPSRIIRLPHHFLLHTVASAKFMLRSKFDVAALREKLPNLKLLHLQFDEEDWPSKIHPQALAERFPGTRATLSDVLRGKHDDRLATATRDTLFEQLSTQDADASWYLRGITITCYETMELYHVYEWNNEIDACGSKYQTLGLVYQIKDGEACIKAKWLEYSRYPDSYITTSAEEAVQLIEKNSAR